MISGRGISGKDAFVCRRCGRCCRWPGAVVVSDAEVDAIAAHLRLDTASFLEKYTRLTPDRKALSLTENAAGHCVFLDGDSSQCLIQDVKPKQCRDFPLRWNFPGWEEECEGGRMMKP